MFTYGRTVTHATGKCSYWIPILVSTDSHFKSFFTNREDHSFIDKVINLVRDVNHLEFCQGQIDSNCTHVLETFSGMDKYIEPVKLSNNG